MKQNVITYLINILPNNYNTVSFKSGIATRIIIIEYVGINIKIERSRNKIGMMPCLATKLNLLPHDNPTHMYIASVKKQHKHIILMYDCYAKVVFNCIIVQDTILFLCFDNISVLKFHELKIYVWQEMYSK